MTSDAPPDPAQPEWYRIRIEGHLDQRWTSWFDDLSLSRGDDGTTLIQGPVTDQAALHGLLAKVRDMGLPLLSVTRGHPQDAGTEVRSRRRTGPRVRPPRS